MVKRSGEKEEFSEGYYSTITTFGVTSQLFVYEIPTLCREAENFRFMKITKVETHVCHARMRSYSLATAWCVGASA
jgi:hypothetical protein